MNNEEKIIRKLEEHDKRFDTYDRRFDENDKRFDEHEKRLDLLASKAMEHDERFDRLEKKVDNLAKNTDEGQDEILTILRRIETETISSSHAIVRHDKDIIRIKEKLSLT